MWNLAEPGARFRAAAPNHPEALLEEPQAFQAVEEKLSISWEIDRMGPANKLESRNPIEDWLRRPFAYLDQQGQATGRLKEQNFPPLAPPPLH